MKPCLYATVVTYPRDAPAAVASDGSPADDDSAGALRDLIARPLTSESVPRIIPAPAERAWINVTDQRFVRRCLPLTVANQSGWWILNPVPFQVTWMGRDRTEDLVIEAPGPARPLASSHFGYGIVTFSIPYLFRTPPGYGLLVRGPANLPKDGIQPLEGIVETDWIAATFTMNWRVTRPFDPIPFAVDEPICMIVPQRRGELEEFDPRVAPLDGDAELASRYGSWLTSRNDFIRDLPHTARGAAAWQKDYFQGRDVDGTRHVDDHCVRRTLRPFARVDEE